MCVFLEEKKKGGARNQRSNGWKKCRHEKQSLIHSHHVVRCYKLEMCIRKCMIARDSKLETVFGW